jgi:serine/threonine-protein kinase
MTLPDALVRKLTTSTSSSPGSLPGDLLADSCRRVGVAALVFVFLWAVALLINNVVVRWGAMGPPVGAEAFPMPGNLIAGAGLATGIGMLFVARQLHERPLLLLDVGLGFVVLQSFLAALLQWWVPPPHVSGISWLVLIILVYPSIAPHTPRRILAASLLAASMDPVGIAIAHARGAPVPYEGLQYVWVLFPTYVSAFLAMLPAHIIRTLGRQVSAERELGAYQLGDLISRGGMGEVHHATHRLLARPAAIKLIRGEVLGASEAGARSVMLERFRREASAAAELRSPHTIELYDFGVTDDGSFYYVMELLEGLDLESMVEQFGPLPAERAVHFLPQAALSLGEAHQRGLIHRDVKPSNIYATRAGLAVDFVKVLDFGLVKASREREEITLTAPQVATGTPAFMAPEVALGDDIDARADVYSLGCVAFWLLTGQLVFDADSAMTMMHRQIDGTPAAPSQRSELPVPPELDALVLACLAKAPEDRPRDGADLVRRLDAVPLPALWSEERARQWWRTHAPDSPARASVPQLVGAAAPATA